MTENTSEESGFTELMKICWSCDYDDIDEVQALIRHGDVNAKTQEGYTALHCAATADDPCRGGRIIELLLDAGANLEARACVQCGEKWTPLMEAVWEGCAAQVKALVNRGANVEATDSEGHTPLILATITIGDVLEKVECLLAAGARATRRDLDGMNALDHARHTETVTRSLAEAPETGERFVGHLAEIRQAIRLLEDAVERETRNTEKGDESGSNKGGA